MAVTRIFIAGFGGQGVLLIGQMLAYAAMYEGKEVTWMPSYGPEMRGGTANCTVCISDDKPITSPHVAKCDVLVAMNGPSLEKFESMAVPGGHVFVNTSVIDFMPKRTDVQVHCVDTQHIAEQVVGNGKTANMVMLGAVIRTTGAVSPDTMSEVFAKKMTGSKARLIPLNEAALSAWQEK